MPKIIKQTSDLMISVIVKDNKGETIAVKAFDFDSLNLLQFIFYSEEKQLDVLYKKADKWAENVLSLHYKYNDR